MIWFVQHLSKPLEVQYENIRQGPQAEFDPTLLELPAMGAAPGIIWGQLEGIQEEDINKISQRGFTFYESGCFFIFLKAQPVPIPSLTALGQLWLTTVYIYTLCGPKKLAILKQHWQQK